jgi:hydrogenase-4 component F
MILIAFVACGLAALAGVILSRDQRQMNTACIAQSVAFFFLAGWFLLSGQVPATALAVGAQYFFIDHLGIYEVLISTVIFTCAGIYARGYVEGLL